MDAVHAARTLEVIRTLMERTTQYQLLTARAGLAAGSLASVGALAFVWLDASNPLVFGLVWGGVFFGSLAATVVSTIWRGRTQGEKIWSRQARAVVWALMPALLAALALSVVCFVRGDHVWLPGVWMLCYGQGASATAPYAPAPIRYFGFLTLMLGAVTLGLGPAWAVLMMGLVFGAGHITLGIVLLAAEQRQRKLRLHRWVA